MIDLETCRILEELRKEIAELREKVEVLEKKQRFALVPHEQSRMRPCC